MPMATSPPRLGLRALVTRPRAEAAALAEALMARGIEAIVEPLLDIHYRDGPAPDLAGVQAVLCTSANGVRALARLNSERAVPLFAVGEASAARAREEGFACVESAGGNVADLARLARERLRPERGRLLHVAGNDVAGDLVGELQRGGFAGERPVLFDAPPAARPRPPLPRDGDRARRGGRRAGGHRRRGAGLGATAAARAGLGNRGGTSGPGADRAHRPPRSSTQSGAAGRCKKHHGAAADRWANGGDDAAARPPHRGARSEARRTGRRDRRPPAAPAEACNGPPSPDHPGPGRRQ